MIDGCMGNEQLGRNEGDVSCWKDYVLFIGTRAGKASERAM